MKFNHLTKLLSQLNVLLRRIVKFKLSQSPQWLFSKIHHTLTYTE